MSTNAISPSEALLTAVYGALNSDATLRTLIEAYRGEAAPTPLPVYESAAPPDEPKPFLVFNDVSDVDWNSSEAFGREVLLDVHAHTQTAGGQPSPPLQARRLLRQAELLLRDRPLQLADAGLVYLRPTAIRVDPMDGTMAHGTLTLRALVEEF